MANTYFQLYIHAVFAVKERASCMPPTSRNEIFSYIAGIINSLGHRSMAVGGTDNHVHVLMSYNPDVRLSDTMREIKANSARFINQQRYIRCRFGWQRGYAAFSYSQSHVDAVIRYIMNQPMHHRNMTLDEEICKMMERYDITYDNKYRLYGV